MTEPQVDRLPPTSTALPPEKEAKFELVGNEVVDALETLILELKGVSSEKDAVLRMIGIFYSARGQNILIQRDGQPPLLVQDVWK